MLRHHVLEDVLQRAVKAARQKAGIVQPVSCHALRHCFATHVLESGARHPHGAGVVGRKDVSTTQIYTHVMQKPGIGVRSPLDGP